jgi:hypothetical protein
MLLSDESMLPSDEFLCRCPIELRLWSRVFAFIMGLIKWYWGSNDTLLFSFAGCTSVVSGDVDNRKLGREPVE